MSEDVLFNAWLSGGEIAAGPRSELLLPKLIDRNHCKEVHANKTLVLEVVKRIRQLWYQN
jgi:hypothetical protein